MLQQLALNVHVKNLTEIELNFTHSMNDCLQFNLTQKGLMLNHRKILDIDCS